MVDIFTFLPAPAWCNFWGCIMKGQLPLNKHYPSQQNPALVEDILFFCSDLYKLLDAEC